MDKSGAQRETEAGDIALGLISLELVFKNFETDDMCQGGVLREGN